MKAQNYVSTAADWLQHINSSLVHFALSLQILFKESQGAEQRAVILQDLDVVCHIPIHLKVLLGLQESMEQCGDSCKYRNTTDENEETKCLCIITAFTVTPETGLGVYR